MRHLLLTTMVVAAALVMFGHCPGHAADPAASEFVTISGPVRSPGQVPWTADLTLTEAISSAGGIGFGSPREVFIIRGNQKITVHLRAIRKGTEPDPQLKPSDKIEVPN